MTKMHPFPPTVNDLLRHPQWDGYISSVLGNELFINDPERAERINDAAEHGADGSTHYETIQNWRDFADMLYRNLSWDEREEVDEIKSALMAEIDACEEWHEKNSSLHETIG